MATATYTSTIFKNQLPKAVHAGDQSVTGEILWGAASTVGDVAFLCKIPHGATIVDFWEYHTTGATAQVLQFGLSAGVAAGGGAGLSCLMAGTAQASMNRFNYATWKSVAGNIGPLTVSLSDLATPRYAILQAQVNSGTTTTSLKVAFAITYRMDGPYPQGGGAGT